MAALLLAQNNDFNMDKNELDMKNSPYGPGGPGAWGGAMSDQVHWMAVEL